MLAYIVPAREHCGRYACDSSRVRTRRASFRTRPSSRARVCRFTSDLRSGTLTPRKQRRRMRTFLQTTGMQRRTLFLFAAASRWKFPEIFITRASTISAPRERRSKKEASIEIEIEIVSFPTKTPRGSPDPPFSLKNALERLSRYLGICRRNTRDAHCVSRCTRFWIAVLRNDDRMHCK